MIQPCPECAGPHVRNYVFKHDPLHCALRAAEDATQAADHERLAATGYAPLLRLATGAEVTLVTALRGTAPTDPAPMTEVHALVDGVLVRTVDGYRPEAVST